LNFTEKYLLNKKYAKLCIIMALTGAILANIGAYIVEDGLLTAKATLGTTFWMFQLAVIYTEMRLKEVKN